MGSPFSNNVRSRFFGLHYFYCVENHENATSTITRYIGRLSQIAQRHANEEAKQHPYCECNHMVDAVCNNLTMFSIVFGGIVAIAGWFVGDRLATRRHRRREFNAIADGIRAALIAERRTLTPSATGIADIDADALLSRFSGKRRSDLESAIADYRKSKTDIYQDSYGQTHYQRPEAVQSAIDRLLTLTIPK